MDEMFSGATSRLAAEQRAFREKKRKELEEQKRARQMQLEREKAFEQQKVVTEDIQEDDTLSCGNFIPVIDQKRLGDRIILPSSVLELLERENDKQGGKFLQYPLTFRIDLQHEGKTYSTCCGVLEFSGKENEIILPQKCAASLPPLSPTSPLPSISPYTKVQLWYLPLEKCSQVSLSFTNFDDYENLMNVFNLDSQLEFLMRETGIVTLSLGDVFEFYESHQKKNISLSVSSLSPADRVCMIETDVECSLLTSESNGTRSFATVTFPVSHQKLTVEEFDLDGERARTSKIKILLPFAVRQKLMENPDSKITIRVRSHFPSHACQVRTLAQESTPPLCSLSSPVIYVSSPPLGDASSSLYHFCSQFCTQPQETYQNYTETLLPLSLSDFVNVRQQYESTAVSLIQTSTAPKDPVPSFLYAEILSSCCASETDISLEWAEVGPSSGREEPQEPGEKGEKCEHCERYFPPISIKMHQISCLRRFSKCSRCNLLVRKDLLPQHIHCDQCEQVLSSASKLQQHIKFFHSPLSCEHCDQQLPDRTALLSHIKNSCEKNQTSITCRFCGALTQKNKQEDEKIDPRDRFFGLSYHESVCGSRTVPCDQCGVRIRLKEMETHIIASHTPSPFL